MIHFMGGSPPSPKVRPSQPARLVPEPSGTGFFDDDDTPDAQHIEDIGLGILNLSLSGYAQPCVSAGDELDGDSDNDDPPPDLMFETRVEASDDSGASQPRVSPDLQKAYFMPRLTPRLFDLAHRTLTENPEEPYGELELETRIPAPLYQRLAQNGIALRAITMAESRYEAKKELFRQVQRHLPEDARRGYTPLLMRNTDLILIPGKSEPEEIGPEEETAPVPENAERQGREATAPLPEKKRATSNKGHHKPQ